jgi:hypothetical protein
LEFVRQGDLRIGSENADLGRRRGLIESDRDRQLQDLEPAGEQAREGIAGSFESRGLFGAGGMERDVARQRAAQASRAGALQAGAAGQVSDIEADVARRIAEIHMQRALERASLLGQGYV